MIEVLQVSGVSHRYGSARAVEQVELRVIAGECVALLGPNGAGKTTLVNLVTGLLATQIGRVSVVGGSPTRAATRRELGVVQQRIGFPRTLTVGEIVRGAAIRAGAPTSTVGPVLVEVGLSDLRRRRAAKLSGGQHQRLQLAMALVGDPALLVLDEPTTGLDAASRRAFWQTLGRRRDRGAGVLLTTHQLDEAAAVADRVVVLSEGRVAASGTPASLAARLPNRLVSARTRVRPAAIRAVPGTLEVVQLDSLVQVSTTRPEALVRELLAADPDLSDLRIEGASLEQAVLAITTTGMTTGTTPPTMEREEASA